MFDVPRPAWAEKQVLPLGVGCFEYFKSFDVHLFEDNDELVYEDNVDVLLGFSITLAASASLMQLACMPASNTISYALEISSKDSLVATEEKYGDDKEPMRRVSCINLYGVVSDLEINFT